MAKSQGMEGGAVLPHPTSALSCLQEPACRPAAWGLGDSKLGTVERLCFNLGHQKGAGFSLSLDPMARAQKHTHTHTHTPNAL